ncbi:hypothetical protein TNCV_2935501 [Trichonephila clavipes]|nr:hypothetical protein TNCV_2935501 [Trichonephila clavipes]
MDKSILELGSSSVQLSQIHYLDLRKLLQAYRLLGTLNPVSGKNLNERNDKVEFSRLWSTAWLLDERRRAKSMDLISSRYRKPKGHPAKRRKVLSENSKKRWQKSETVDEKNSNSMILQRNPLSEPSTSS